MGALAAMVALATPPTRTRLDYLAKAPTCPEQRDFEASVSARLGVSPFDEAAPRLARVRFVPQGTGLRGTLELLEGTRSLGRREFASAAKDCVELASSVSLALAIAIDPQHLERPAPQPAPPPTPAPAPAAPPPAVIAPSPPPSPGPPLAIGLGAFGGIATGLAPVLTGGGGFELAGRVGAFELAGRGRLDATVGTPDLQVGALSGSLALCGVIPWVGLCAVGAGSALTLKGPALTVTQGVALAGGRLTGRFEPFPKVWVLPFVELLAVLTRITALSGEQVLWTSAPFTFSAGLTVRYDFVRESQPTRPNILSWSSPRPTAAN